MSNRILLSPLDRPVLIAFLIILQLVKLTIIVSKPNSAGFLMWFYGFSKYPPYSFDNRTVGNIPFPVPYSMLWYSYYWITRYGYWAFNLTTFAIDTALIIVVASNHSQFYTAYISQMSMYFLIVSPQDYLIFLFIILGRIRFFFLPLAILTKLPLIPPITQPAIWNFILTNPYAIHDSLNWARYTMIASAWLVSLVLWSSDRGIFTRSRMVNKIFPREFLDFIGRKNESNQRPTRGTARHRDRSRARCHRCHVHFFSVHRAGHVQRSPGARHHRTTDIRSHHPLRCLSSRLPSRQPRVSHKQEISPVQVNTESQR